MTIIVNKGTKNKTKRSKKPEKVCKKNVIRNVYENDQGQSDAQELICHTRLEDHC